MQKNFNPHLFCSPPRSLSLSLSSYFLAHSYVCCIFIHRVYLSTSRLCCKYELICWFYNWLVICKHKPEYTLLLFNCKSQLKNPIEWRDNVCVCVCEHQHHHHHLHFECSTTCHVVSASDKRPLHLSLNLCTETADKYYVIFSGNKLYAYLLIMIIIYLLYVITISMESGSLWWFQQRNLPKKESVVKQRDKTRDTKRNIWH